MSDASTTAAAAVVADPAGPAEPTARDAEARWREPIAAQRASGLSVARFCRERGVPAPSLFAWRRRLGNGAGGGGE